MRRSRARLPLIVLGVVGALPCLIVLVGVPACGKLAPEATGEGPTGEVAQASVGPLPEDEITKRNLKACAGEPTSPPSATAPPGSTPPTALPPPPEACDCAYGATRAVPCVPAVPREVVPCYKAGEAQTCDASHYQAEDGGHLYGCYPKTYSVASHFCGYQVNGSCGSATVVKSVTCEGCWIWTTPYDGTKRYDCRAPTWETENRPCVPGTPKIIKEDGQDGFDVKNWCTVHQGILEPVPDPNYPGRQMCSGTCDRTTLDAWNSCLPVAQPPVPCDWCPTSGTAGSVGAATGSVAVLGPTPNATVSSFVEVWGRAVLSPATNAQLYIDGTIRFQSDIQPGGYYFFRWDSTKVANGAHALAVHVTHPSIPMPSPATFSVTVSNAPSPPPTTSGSASGSASASASGSASSSAAPSGTP